MIEVPERADHVRHLKGSASVELSSRTPRGVAQGDLAALFAHIGIATASLDSRILVCAACGIDHAGLIRDPDLPLGAAADVLTAYAARRLDHMPVSRILGRREFWGLPFAIGPDVLDPRPETEGVVGSVLDALANRRETDLRVLDLGTGSGAILCALMRELPRAVGIGVDRSRAACRVARENVESLGVSSRASIVCGSWADALAGGFDVVVSNPPYIPRPDLANLDREVREHDPSQALDGGTDGLDAYHAIAPRLQALLRPAGVAVLECGWNQGEAVATLVRRHLDGAMVYKDFAGYDRIVVAHNP